MSGARTRLVVGRFFVPIAALVALAVPLTVWLWPSWTGPDDGAPCGDCNVLLVTVDTLRADHLSLYGYERTTSPELDRYLRDATLFDNATSPSPCTRPSVLQFLTGTLDHDSTRPRLAERLLAHGYTTAAVVSQHWFGTAEAPLAEYARGFEVFDVQPASRVDRYGMTARRADEVADRAIVLLEQLPADRKFFLWLHLFDPHDPYEPPDLALDRWPEARSVPDGDRRWRLIQADRADVDREVWRDIAGRYTGLRKHTWRMYGHIFNEDEIAGYVARYDAEIAWADRQIGRVLDYLAGRGLMERTVVVFTSDHGERLGEQGIWDHCLSLHEDEIRVPLAIAVGATGLTEERRATRPVSTLDIVPTVLRLVGRAADPTEFDGIDLTRPSEREVVSLWESTAALRDGPFKLVVDHDQQRMYDLDTDPREERNLASTDSERLAELRARLDAYMARRSSLDDALAEIGEDLRALGYID